MTESTSAQELRDRLDLIERMIADGRRSTQRWGWAFVLWGVAFLIAILWSAWRPGSLAWPLTMAGGMIATLAIARRRRTGYPGTTIGRAVMSVWAAIGISMMVLFVTLGVSGRMDEHSFVATVAAMLGAANAASGLILRWRMQAVCALIWWIAGVTACFGEARQPIAAFLVAIVLCQILFGIYAMICDSRQTAHTGAVHV